MIPFRINGDAGEKSCAGRSIGWGWEEKIASQVQKGPGKPTCGSQALRYGQGGC